MNPDALPLIAGSDNSRDVCEGCGLDVRTTDAVFCDCPEEPLRCGSCGEQFDSFRELNDHVGDEHREPDVSGVVQRQKFGPY